MAIKTGARNREVKLEIIFLGLWYNADKERKRSCAAMLGYCERK